jgi:ABC-2 type transport system permease protein
MMRLIDQGKVKMGLILPWDFSKTIKAEKIASVQALIDGADANTANLILSYAQAIAQQYTQEKTVLKVTRMGMQNVNFPVEARPRVWFNEELESRNFIIPGLIAVILMMIAAMLTSLTVAREWERGTMELLISTPVRKGELMIGKLFPYFFFVRKLEYQVDYLGCCSGHSSCRILSFYDVYALPIKIHTRVFLIHPCNCRNSQFLLDSLA